ncbi:LysR family transcriptional regulator [Rhizobium paknamense]|uniref:DNA-binding transcriptional LysR family regulator n=1 Tax=Rhizobium paknamense TaxID=1206817 RepID=A0ABU0IDK8_9HYPH|nr:LysR family transcriptional regulator [Rhizobium paknamense]MDQ0456266.1 DNA-binding transcriptional LysR family regulator [Rhizobium paknamense]
MSKPLAWDDLRLVKAVAEAKGMAGAAAALQVDHSTIFRRLGALERALGTPLFERRRGGYDLTPAGEEVLAAAERIDSEVHRLERRLTGKEIAPAGEIRVATADSLLMHLLTPLFYRFRATCPAIRLDVVIGNSALNLSRRDADIAIRATDTPPETLVGRRIGSIAWALYGRGQDRQARGEAFIDTADWVALSQDMASLKVVRDTRQLQPERLVYRANSVLALAEAVEAGIGIGHLPCFIGDVRPGLARLSDPVRDYAAELWLLTHQDIRHAPRIRVFMDFIAAELVPLRPLIEGMSGQFQIG